MLNQMLDISAPHLAQISCRNSVGMIFYITEHFGENTLSELFAGILAGKKLISTNYQYLGTPLTLDYFKNENNWYSNEINLKIFDNLSTLGVDAFNTGRYAIMRASNTKNIATIAYLQMLGIEKIVKKLNTLNGLYNRTKTMNLSKVENNSVTIQLNYNCPHNAQVTRQNIGAFVGGMEVAGLDNITWKLVHEDFTKRHKTIITLSWQASSRAQKIQYLLKKRIALLFCKSYLQSYAVINDFHQNVIVGFENEIVEKEVQRKKSETYFNQLIEQQDKKEQELASLVKEKTYLLQLAVQQKNTLFENVSHELKTPLTLILGRSEQLLKRKDLNTINHNEVKHIEASAEHLYQLVNQLLELAEIKHHTQLKIPVDIIGETNLLCESLSSLAQSAGMAITYQRDTDLAAHWLELQQGAWSSIMTNLVSNAIKYGDEYFGVHVSLEISEVDVKLTVVNKGEIIKVEQLEKIFNRFEQLDNKQQGQGLGLAIVKELVSNHGGSVSAISLNNETAFTVALPNKANKISQREAIQPLPASNKKVNNSTSKQHILIVEDNQELREFISSALSMQFNVTAVEHGQAAIDWLTSTNALPDLILSDVMMPVMNGYEFCEKLKQDPEYQSIPLFLLTAKADSASVKKGFALAADDYIAKPFNTDVLITKIGNQLATREALKKNLKAKLLTAPENLSLNKPSSDPDQILYKVNTLLEANFSNADIKSADIAKALHMQEKTLNRKLQTLVGCSISELIREYRLNKAKQLLEQYHKPKNVCFDCGFNSVSYFGQNFKHQFGVTPSAYQQKYQTSQVE
jgi:signal transduction histidine kinase/CheY-like chemotaxis protein